MQSLKVLQRVNRSSFRAQKTLYYHNDHLATPQKMTDSTGAVVWSADYKPFGEATVTISTITNNLRFPGQYYDAETGLNYNYYRHYNAQLDRYNEADPVGLRGGINLYLYAGANSLRYTDPRGLLLGGPGATIGNPPGSVIGPQPPSPSVPGTPGSPVCMKCAQPPGLPPAGPGMCTECDSHLGECIGLALSDSEQLEGCKTVCEFAQQAAGTPYGKVAKLLCYTCALGKAGEIAYCFQEHCYTKECCKK